MKPTLAEVKNGTILGPEADNGVPIHVISDPGSLQAVGDKWDDLVGRHSGNPLFLSSYVKNRMEHYLKQGWSPLILLLSEGDEIIGSIPIRVKKRLGIRFAKFLLEPHFSPDFIFGDGCRDVCVEESLRFLFRALNLHYLDLTLQSESPNLPALKRACKNQRVTYYESAGNAHQVLPIKYTWEEYVRHRGKKFKKFDYLERRLGREGSWRIEYFENDEIGRDVFDRVRDIERRSWKERWRVERELPDDEHHPMIWTASEQAEKSSDYDWRVYILTLDGRDISYTIVLRYKDESVVLKTSYDDGYSSFSPGKFVINAAVRDQFRDERVRVIEFMTDLPFTQIWGTTSLPRVRMVMSHSRFLPKMVGHFSESSLHGDITISQFTHSLFDGQKFRNLVMDLQEG